MGYPGLGNTVCGSSGNDVQNSYSNYFHATSITSIAATINGLSLTTESFNSDYQVPVMIPYLDIMHLQHQAVDHFLI